MPQFMITYLGTPQPASPDEGQKHMAKYKEWLAALGDSAVSPANPLKNTKTINPDGSVEAGGSTAMSGFTIIAAESEDEALSVAKACPYLEIGGSLEISEVMKMPG